jgi:hypothetical protein
MLPPETAHTFTLHSACHHVLVRICSWVGRPLGREAQGRREFCERAVRDWLGQVDWPSLLICLYLVNKLRTRELVVRP